MPRKLHITKSFPGKDYHKELVRLTPKQRKQITESMGKLFNSLNDCGNILVDPAINQFRPTKYFIPGRVAGSVQLIEYRCINLTRVIIAYCTVRDYVWFLAATVSHNHKRLGNQVSTAISELREDFSPQMEDEHSQL